MMASCVRFTSKCLLEKITCRQKWRKLNSIPLKAIYDVTELSYRRCTSAASKPVQDPTVTGDVLRSDSLTSAKMDTVDDPAFSKIDLSFENAREAYMSKRNLEILRCYIVFQMCSVSTLVDNAQQIMKFARRVLGKYLFEKVMKATFYGHFVAGEDAQRILPHVQRNMSFGVKSILQYTVEQDISREEPKAADKNGAGDLVDSAPTYDHEDEYVCDENVKKFLKCIDAVSTATGATGFASLKLTALGRPQFLLHLSAVLTAVRRHFETLSRLHGGMITEKDLESHLRSSDLDAEERRKWLTMLDVSKDGEIDLLDWHNLLDVNIRLGKVLRIPNPKTGCLEPVTTGLTELEEQQLKNMLRRIDAIVRYAIERDVRVMIDAEQSYLQAALNRLCTEMMRTYNREKAYVYNTYQCYLKDAVRTLTTDLALSKREGFYFGAKLVRGAYMDQERLRAASLSYEDPILPTFEATSKMYEDAVAEVLHQINSREKGTIAVMIATHNEDTVRMAINKMREFGVKSTDGLICFGQLYGMSDQLSFSLGQAGYSAYKCVHYGPIEEVLPYLSRRALENRGVLAKVKKEKRLLRTELLRRLVSFNWFYKPSAPDSRSSAMSLKPLSSSKR